MGPGTSSTIKNHPERVEVYNLAKLAQKHPDFPLPAGGRGPFAIWQEGTAPGDSSLKILEFFLTKEGKWLPLYAFLAMEVEERRQLCLYDTAATAMECIASLTGVAEVDAERIAKAKSSGAASPA